MVVKIRRRKLVVATFSVKCQLTRRAIFLNQKNHAPQKLHAKHQEPYERDMAEHMYRNKLDDCHAAALSKAKKRQNGMFVLDRCAKTPTAPQPL
jgi:hypothetical protein